MCASSELLLKCCDLHQALGAENDSHSSDEVPYPSQYNSPLIHAAVASPPLTSPKISPQPAAVTNTRTNHPTKNMVPLEPLKIDPTAGYYYLPNTSPQSRPSPQPRVVHSTPTMVRFEPAIHYAFPSFGNSNNLLFSAALRIALALGRTTSALYASTVHVPTLHAGVFPHSVPPFTFFCW